MSLLMSSRRFAPPPLTPAKNDRHRDIPSSSDRGGRFRNAMIAPSLILAYVYEWCSEFPDVTNELNKVIKAHQRGKVYALPPSCAHPDIVQDVDTVLRDLPDLLPELSRLVNARQRGLDYIIPMGFDAAFETRGASV
jgi:hypothetical protein